MRIQIVANVPTGAKNLRAYAARRLRFAIARFGNRVPRARVRIADVNGPRGGIDMECLVEVVVKGVGVLLVKAVAASPYTAIDVATDRMRGVVARQVRRLSERRGLAQQHLKRG